MVLKFFIKRVWKLIVLFMVVLILSSFCFYIFEYEEPEDREEGYSGPDDFADSFWYSIVTLSTVGYGDRYPVTTEGKIASFFLIVFTFTFLGVIIGKVSDAFKEAREREMLGMEGTDFDDHVVICGWTNIGKVTLDELMATKQKTVVITDDEDEIIKIRDAGDEDYIYTVYGDYKNKKVLKRANIQNATTIVIATDDDTESLIISLTVKELNPDARMIVSIQNDELKNTLYSAGVTYVSSPSEMAGRMVASAAFEPEVARFIEDVTTSTSGYDVQQYRISSRSYANGITVGKFQEKVRKEKGPLLVALGKYRPGEKRDEGSPKNWKLITNPAPDVQIKENDILVVIGDRKENERLAKSLNLKQGR
ncbi:MAG: potassium channel protein [Candidatus Thermoplasmatota archaeon]|nr:potassium channel protein [Candidatus Thermoplasmatota archaeon]MBS3790764.1 potassium channel protein [Candidatus Thermoplasmatota archaeon]